MDPKILKGTVTFTSFIELIPSTATEGTLEFVDRFKNRESEESYQKRLKNSKKTVRKILKNIQAK